MSWKWDSYRAETNAAYICVAFLLPQWGIMLWMARALQLGKAYCEDTGWKKTWLLYIILSSAKYYGGQRK